MSASEVWQSAKQRVESAKAEMKASCKDAFTEMSAALFNEHPVLRSFSWTQYTPYFNDGDPCVFSTSAEYPCIRFSDDSSDADEDDEDEDGDEFSMWRVTEARKEGRELTPHERAGAAVVELLQVLGDDGLEDLFGDHVKVTCSRDGTEADEYSHD